MTAPCPPADRLDALLGDALPAADRERLVAHVEGCPACQTELDRRTAGPDLRAWQAGDPDAGTHVPEQFGPYRVVAEIGRGGMGVVYRADDPDLQRAVAVKALRAADPDARGRFVREARAAARVASEHVVRILAAETPTDGPAYLVMEFVDGPTLRHLAADGLSPRRAAELVAQAADGLAAAHAAGLVHRDVKPANVLVTADGTAKVADFGLARAADGTVLTRSGMLVGSPAYMAPEQVRDPSAADPRADVYSLGATLYECLTGREPFRGSVQLVVQQVLDGDPVPPRRLNPDVPRDLETVCLKAMAPDPARRYPSAAAVRDDLRRWLAGEPVQARPVGRLGRAARWVRRHPTEAGLLAAVLAVVLAGFAGVTWQWRKADARRREAEASYLRACESLRHWIDDAERGLRTAHGLTPARREWLDRALARFRGGPGDPPPDPAAEFAIASTQVLIGLHATESGRPADAEAALLDAERLFARAAAAGPRNRHAELYEANAHLYLGELHLHVTGRADEAAARYARVRAFYRHLAAAEPDNPQWRRNVALCEYLTARADIARGDLPAARVGLDAARAIVERLVAEYPNEADYRHRRASIDQFDGEYYLLAGDPTRAAGHLERCRAVREEELLKQPWDIRFQRDMARVDRLLGRAEAARGNATAAAAAFARARARLEPLAAANPHLPRFRAELAAVTADAGR